MKGLTSETELTMAVNVQLPWRRSRRGCGSDLSVSRLQGYNIRLGRDFYCNFNCVFLDTNEISIGDNVLFGPNVQVQWWLLFKQK